MSKDKVIDSLTGIDDDMIQAVEALRRKKRHVVWLKWGALAACLCLVVALAIPTALFESADTPRDTVEPGADSTGPAGLTVNGIKYLISSHVSVTDELPDGFSYAGETAVGGFENCPYYTNPDMPEWVYVSQEVLTDGTVDSSGTLNRTDPHDAYVRYVDIRLRGRDIVCYNGDYYISMWSVHPSGEHADVSYEYYEKMEATYGIRIEGEAPQGYVSVGIADFAGYDTVPTGTLACNEGTYEIFANPEDTNVILVSTEWYTAPVGENGETHHTGFNIYIKYDCPFA